jgi:mannose-6-phosphate isomerase
MKLARHYVEKPWGRTGLPAAFGVPAGKQIGEVWFDGGPDLPLLAKYIFTSERLSIQVHPNDEQARARGLAQGKSECWYILDAEPGATLGLGLKRAVSKDELRAAALVGSIEGMMNRRLVKAGDFVYVPSGTIHAIGAGISLLEFQQNSDVTYRLYDYGRPRELHLDDGLDVATAGPFAGAIQHPTENGTLVEGPHFTLAMAREDALQNRQRWIMPLGVAHQGDCFLLEPGEHFEANGERLLIGTAATLS